MNRRGKNSSAWGSDDKCNHILAWLKGVRIKRKRKVDLLEF